MYEKINVIVINSIFDMGTLDNAIEIKTTRHIIKCSFSSVLWKVWVINDHNKDFKGLSID